MLRYSEKFFFLKRKSQCQMFSYLKVVSTILKKLKLEKIFIQTWWSLWLESKKPAYWKLYPIGDNYFPQHSYRRDYKSWNLTKFYSLFDNAQPWETGANKFSKWCLYSHILYIHKGSSKETWLGNIYPYTFILCPCNQRPNENQNY